MQCRCRGFDFVQMQTKIFAAKLKNFVSIFESCTKMEQSSSDNICRICLNVQDTLFSLYRKRHGTSPYEKLISRTKLSIKLNDSGPPSICSQCLIDLDTTVSFLDKCERSNQLLSATYARERSIFKDIETETEKLFETPSEVSEVDARDLKTNVVVFPEEKCGECGSKRRCKHWAPPTVHTCQYCKKTFNKKYNYQLHVKRHVGASWFPCGACGAALGSRWAATRHCAAPRRRVCPVPACARSFTTATNLRTHLRTHTGERPFKCDDCGKTFISKNILNNHVRIHTGVKPYMCQICGKQFTTNKLAAHVAAHAARARPPSPSAPRARPRPRPRPRPHDPAAPAAPRPHACALCDCTYKFKQSLNYHVKNTHGVGAIGKTCVEVATVVADEVVHLTR